MPLNIRNDEVECLVDEVWARIPDDQIGRAPDKTEREAILGYGPEGA